MLILWANLLVTDATEIRFVQQEALLLWLTKRILRDGFPRPRPPNRTGRARIFLSSWLHLRPVIAGMCIWDIAFSNGSNRSRMSGKVLKKYCHSNNNGTFVCVFECTIVNLATSFVVDVGIIVNLATYRQFTIGCLRLNYSTIIPTSTTKDVICCSNGYIYHIFDYIMLLLFVDAK